MLHQHRIEVVQRLVPHRKTCLDSCAADVRQQHHIVQIEQCGRHIGLVDEHVQPGPGQPTAGDQLHQRVLVYDAAATLRARRYELILATRALLAARGRAERILATSAASEYQRVREACAELAADLEECDPDGAVDEGIARHESPEEED